MFLRSKTLKLYKLKFGELNTLYNTIRLETKSKKLQKKLEIKIEINGVVSQLFDIN